MNRTVAILAGLLVLALVAGAGVGIFFWSATPERPQTAATPAPVVTQSTDESSAANEAPAPQAGPEIAETAPVVTPTPAPSADPRRPSFDIVRVSPEGMAIFAGRAEPEWKVFLRDQNKAYASIAADRRGEWVITLDDPLPPGTYEFSLIARNANGSKQAESSKPVLISVPERETGKEKAVPLVVELGDENQGSRVLQADGVGPAQNTGQLTLDAIDYANDGTAVMSGTAPPETTLRVYIDNEDLGDAVTSGGAHWSIPTKSVVSSGPHLVRIDELDPQGKVVSRVEAVFERVDGNAAAGGDKSGSYQVEDGNSLWRIARRYYGDGFLYTEIFQANRTKIADPDLIYPGQIFVLPRPTQNYNN